ncbi:MAG: hypothetical protein PUC70_05285 [bacterium]|nr:hypothetical protein [bacterium]
MEITNIEIKNNKNVAHIVLDNDETIQIIGSFLYGNVYHLFLTKIVNDKKVLFSYKTKDFTEIIERAELKKYEKSDIIKLINLSGLYYFVIFSNNKFFCYSVEPFIELNFELIDNLSSKGHETNLHVKDFTIFYINDTFYALLFTENEQNEIETQIFASKEFKSEYKIIKNFGSLHLVDGTVNSLSSYYKDGLVYVLFDSKKHKNYSSKVMIFKYDEGTKFEILMLSSYSFLRNERNAFFIQGKQNNLFISSILSKENSSKTFLTLPKIINYEKGKFLKKPAKLILNRIISVNDFDFSSKLSSCSLVKIDADKPFKLSFNNTNSTMKILFFEQKFAVEKDKKTILILDTKKAVISLFILLDEDIVEIGINKGEEFVSFCFNQSNLDFDVEIVNDKAIKNFQIGSFKNE